MAAKELSFSDSYHPDGGNEGYESLSDVTILFSEKLASDQEESVRLAESTSNLDVDDPGVKGWITSEE